MDLKDIKNCEYCDSPIDNNDEVFQVMTYDKRGNQEFLKVCSERCALKCKEISYNIHSQMADSVARQSIQKLR